MARPSTGRETGVLDAEAERLLEAAVSAASKADIVGEEQALATLARFVFSHDDIWRSLERRIRVRLNDLSDASQIRRGEFLGCVGDLQLFADRVLWYERRELVVKVVDEHVRASLDAAGEVVRRPTLTRMAIGSVLPGTALIPGLALMRREDRRRFAFAVEHPEWARAVEIPKSRVEEAADIVVAFNAAVHRIAVARAEESTTGARHVGRLEQLRTLGELRDARVLDADEFAREKARILGSDGDLRDE